MHQSEASCLFLKHSDTLEGCQILQLLHGVHVVKLLILLSICLHLILIGNRLRSLGGI